MNKAAQALGALGGAVKSEEKAKASRKNGKRGGRPKSKKYGCCPRCFPEGQKGAVLKREGKYVEDAETKWEIFWVCQNCYLEIPAGVKAKAWFKAETKLRGPNWYKMG